MNNIIGGLIGRLTRSILKTVGIRAFVLASFGLICHASVFLSIANAATITVNSNLDDGANCTLRDAIATINAGSDQSNGCTINTANGALGSNDTIVFNSAVAGGTIMLAGTELSITRSVVINPDSGNPNRVTTTIDANNTSRVFRIRSDDVQMNRLTITGGQTGTFNNGGGIRAESSSSLTLNHCNVSGNSSESSGGGIYLFGTVNATLTNTTISNNSALRGGGGLAMFESATMTMSDSVVYRNTVPDSSGGGILVFDFTRLTVNNSTISENVAGGGIGGGISVREGVSVELNNSTVAANSARFGSQLHVVSSGAPVISVNNSIIANPVSSSSSCSIIGAGVIFNAADDSIDEDGSCSTNAMNVDPQLGPLADNGGPTLTHALLTGSPAIRSAGATTGPNPTATDQRGFAAVGARDIGAFEAQTLGLSLSSNVINESGSNTSTTGTIIRPAPLDAPLTVMVISSNTSAAIGPSSSIVIPANQAQATFTINAVNDQVATGDRVSSISLSAAGFSSESVSLTIIDDERPTLSLALSADTATEGAAAVTATLTRNTPTTNALTVALSSSDSSSAAVPDQVVIPAGASSTTFDITLVDDTIARGAVSNQITASATGITRAQASLTINDNDIAALELELSNNNVNEGDATVVATVSRNTPIDENLTIAVVSSDPSSAAVPSQIIIPAGASSSMFDITLVDDQIVRGTINAQITVSAAGLTSEEASLTVNDNDIAALELELSDNDVSESDAVVVATVSRNTPIVESLTIAVTSSDPSSAGVPSQVVIPAGSSSSMFDITLVDDAIARGIVNNQITVSATGLTNSEAILTINDNDIAALELVLSIYEVDESDAMVVATVRRNTPVSEALVITLASSDPGSASVPASVPINIGEIESAPFIVSTTDNDVIDGDRDVEITASVAGLVSDLVRLTIIDNDDDDGDGIANVLDNCPNTFNPDQADFEGDGLGDVCDFDDDGDGMPDLYEFANGLNPRNSFDRDADADSDGYTNLEEFQFGTDPNLADVDENSNGIPDAAEERDRRNRENAIKSLPSIILILLSDGCGCD